MTAQSRLIFRCPATGEEFDSGVEFTLDEFKRVPLPAKMNVRCPAADNSVSLRSLKGE